MTTVYTDDVTTSAAPTTSVAALRRMLSRFGVYILMAVVFAVTALAIPGFLAVSSVRSLLVLSSILGIASIGQTITIILGGIDLSVAAVIGLSSVMLAVLTAKGWPFWLTALAILGASVVVGVANGLATHAFRAPSLIVTLATASVVTGITMSLNQGSAGGTVPQWITDSVSTNSSTLGIPLPFVVIAWIVLSAVLIVLQRRSPTLRRLYATGMSSSAARLALIRVPLMWMVAFAVSALAAAVAGVFLGGFSGGADIDVGQPYLFLTIAAVVVGGTSLLGGRGGVGRTMAGAVLISNLTTLLLGVGINTNVQQIVLGVLIVLLVFLYGREAHVKGRI